MREIVERALRRISVLAVDEPADPAVYTTAREALEGLVEELRTPWGLGHFTWTLADVPAKVRTPLAYLLAVRLASGYEQPEPEPEKTALVRLRAVCAEFPAVEGDTDEERAEARQRERDEADFARWF